MAGALEWLRRVPRPVLAGVLAIVLVAGLVVAQEVAAAGQVRRGVRVGGVELSGLTRVAATERLRAAADALQASPLTLQAGDATVHPARSKAGVELDVEASVAAAMDVGRGGLFDADRFKGWFGRIDLPWNARVETARLDRQLAALDRKVGSEVREPALRVGGRLVAPGAKGGTGGAVAGGAGAVPVELVAGRPGQAIDRDGAAAALLAAAAAPAGATVSLPITERPPTVAAEAAQAAADRADHPAQGAGRGDRRRPARPTSARPTWPRCSAPAWPPANCASPSTPARSTASSAARPASPTPTPRTPASSRPAPASASSRGWPASRSSPARRPPPC